MDEEGNRRWRGALAPFDGVIISLSNYATLAHLRPMLIVVVTFLNEHFKESSLLTLHDWGEHDEYVTKAEPTSWQQLQSLFVYENSLKGASTGDDYVRTAFFPVDYAFYLRIYVDVESLYSSSWREPIKGDFDVTCQESLAAQIKKALERLGATVHMEPAKSFFDRRYVG